MGAFARDRSHFCDEAHSQVAIDGLIVAGGMTVIVIAHRLSTIRAADAIYLVIAPTQALLLPVFLLTLPEQ